MGSQGAGRVQPMGCTENPNHSDASRRFTATIGATPNAVVMSSMTAAPATDIAAAARSDTANTDGRSPEPTQRTCATLAGPIDRSRAICARNWRVRVSSSGEDGGASAGGFEEPRLTAKPPRYGLLVPPRCSGANPPIDRTTLPTFGHAQSLPACRYTRPTRPALASSAARFRETVHEFRESHPA